MRTIAHISDLHFGRADPAAAEALVHDLHAQRPSVVVASGDFTQRARARQYMAAAEFLKRLPGPQIVVPGNHDIPLYNVAARFFYPLRNYQRYITSDLRPFYVDEQLAVLGINTARSWTWTWNGFWKDGRISDEQLLGVKLRLGDLPSGVFRVVVTHHPFIPPPGQRIHGIVGRATQALDQMVECGVDLLLAGHLHMGYSGDVRTHHEAARRSILSVQAGTAISTRKRSEANAYNLLTIQPDRVDIAVRAYDGRAFDTQEVTSYVRVEDVWRQVE